MTIGGTLLVVFFAYVGYDTYMEAKDQPVVNPAAEAREEEKTYFEKEAERLAAERLIVVEEPEEEEEEPTICITPEDLQACADDLGYCWNQVGKGEAELQDELNATKLTLEETIADNQAKDLRIDDQANSINILLADLNDCKNE